MSRTEHKEPAATPARFGYEAADPSGCADDSAELTTYGHEAADPVEDGCEAAAPTEYADEAATTVDDCWLIELPTIHRPEGDITPIENGGVIPFDIARTYYLYDVPGGASRGGHAHKQLRQLLISVMGAFDVVLDDGERRKTVRLDRAYKGLYIPRMIWRELDNFSSGGICLVLASLPYDESEYVRSYEEFRIRKHSASSSLIS